MQMQSRILNHESFDYENSAIIRPPQSVQENKRTIRMVVDSRDRDTNLFPNSAKYDIKLDEEIEDVVAVELLSAHVPFSGYLINKNNQQFKLSIPSASFDSTIVVETGDYTALQLSTAVNDAITSTLTAAGVAVTFVVSYDERKDGYVFRATAPFALNFVPELCGCLSTLNRVLGFGRTAPISSADESASTPDGHGYVVRSTYRKNFEEVNYLVLDVGLLTVNKSINNVVNKSFAVLGKSDYMNTGVMNRIRKQFNPPVAKFDRMQIAFYDYDGNLYDFQNHDHRMELVFESYKVTRRYLMG